MEVNPTKQPCAICKRLSTEVGNAMEIIGHTVVRNAIMFDLYTHRMTRHILFALTVGQKWIRSENNDKK